MKRIALWTGVGLMAAAAVAALLLFTCVFGNHTYRAAICTEPEACTRCGKTRGEPLGHDESAAACEAPAVCRRCGAVLSAPLGHDFLPADCEHPQICARCGITRGEPLGHVFAPATCTAPEICTRCGITRGEPLGHDMTAPTFQTPAICTRCGLKDGEALPPALLGKALNELAVGVPAPYTTAGYEDRDVDVTGTVEIADYTVTAGDDDFPPRAGYEWHIATVRLVFEGDDAKSNGALNAWTYGDWYLCDNAMTAADDDGLRAFVADWYGTRVTCWQKTGPAIESDWYDRALRFTWREGVLVPEGYDGVLLIFCNYRLLKDAPGPYLPASAALDETTSVFRMK